jgi:NADH-quinone oxidoreductase subunit N
MNLEAVKLAAADNTWTAIFPELILGCLALLLLVLEIVLPKKHHALIPDVAIAGIFGTLVGLFINWNTVWLDTDTFNGLLHHSTGGQILRAFFLLAALFTCLLGRVSLARQPMPKVEFYHVVLIVTGAMMLLAQSNHFVMLFVALETLTIGLYILVSYYRTNPASLEAGLKYLVMGALSSGLLLFGIVLLYGVAGNPALPGHTGEAMRYGQLANFLAANPHHFLASVGVALVLAGLAFKIGAFPFQIWVPDVYQGAPTPVTAFLAVASKGAGFAVLLSLCGANGAFASYAWLTTPALTAMAAATILFGNIAALTQHNVKRLIGLSGVSHAGFLLLGVVAARHSGIATGAIYFYLFAYLIASFAVFGVMTHLAGDDDSDQELDHYSGLAKENPFLAAILAIGLGSLAGIPPLAGFMGKLFVFIAAFQSGARWLLAIAAVGVAMSIYYYFGWIRAAFFETWTPPADPLATPPARPARTPVGFVTGVALGALALASIALGFFQGPLGQWLALK